ncbi:MAG TPA: hypothetical protein VEO01_02445 [Pseudonocardiaceae bacterium]|nr:hypothetical protein [Pseudonocardiaceae bacterium]
MAIQVPAVGDTATAAYADSVANQLNAARLIGTVSTANTATSTGATEVLHANLLLAVTGIVSGTTYMVEMCGRIGSSVATDVTVASVHALQGIVVIGSPVVLGAQAVGGSSGGGSDWTWRYPWTPGASGSWNLQVGVKRALGTGNGTFGGGVMPAVLSLTAV